MISTLIIDDNKIMREYFETMIDWNSIGFELVAVASNGISGWQEFNRHLPQLVITDVQMPGMTGLELSRIIREKSPETVIVFISNYEDFTYVKGAMEVGAFDYILKHETRGKKFDEKLIKIRNHFKQQYQHKRNFLESKLILSFSSVGVTNLQQYFPDKYNLVIIEQSSLLPPFAALAKTDIAEIDENIFQSFFSDMAGSLICAIRIQKYRYAVLLNSECNIEDFAARLDRYLYTQIKQRCHVFPFAKAQPIDVCISEYLTRGELLYLKFFNKRNYLVKTDISPETVTEPWDFNKERLLLTLEQADIDKICELIDHYAHYITGNKNYHQLCLLAELLLDFMVQHSVSELNNKFELFSEKDLKFWTYADEIFFWLENKLIQLVNSLNQNPANTYSPPVKSAINYIQKNFVNNELSAVDIANHVGIDQNKLNKIMKDETGLTAIKWLTKIRIEKAKELLLKDKKLTEIYSEVGYANLSYFSNVFKKVCGVTPLEYRRNYFEKNKKN
ncbi:MAG: response regulator [Ruminococcaceae bacterium]|nr:response regulator [Oscillospiraceae bacterium]